MKKIVLLMQFALFIIISSCHTQKLVAKPEDVYKIKENEQRFINQPLKELLKEISPKIEMVLANPTAYAEHPGIGYFVFKFIKPQQNDSLIQKGNRPISLTVYVQGPFEWDLVKRTKEKFNIWTDEDAIKYGNLKVVAIRGMK